MPPPVGAEAGPALIGAVSVPVAFPPPVGAEAGPALIGAVSVPVALPPPEVAAAEPALIGVASVPEEPAAEALLALAGGGGGGGAAAGLGLFTGETVGLDVAPSPSNLIRPAS